MMDSDERNGGKTPEKIDPSEGKNILSIEEVEGLQEELTLTEPDAQSQVEEEVEICQFDLTVIQDEEMELGVSAQGEPDESNRELCEVREGVEQGEVDNTDNVRGIDNGLEGLCALEEAIVAEESDKRELGVIEGLCAFEGAFLDEESEEIELRVIYPDKEETSPVCRVDQGIHQLEKQNLEEVNIDEQPQGRIIDEADTSPDRGVVQGIHVFDEIATVQNEGALRIQELHAILHGVESVERNPSLGGRSTHSLRARYHQRLAACDRRQRKNAFEIPFLKELHERFRNLSSIAEDSLWSNISTASLDQASSVTDSDRSSSIRSLNQRGSSTSLTTLRSCPSLEAITNSSSTTSMSGVFLVMNDSDGMASDMQNMPNEDNKSIKSNDSLSTTTSWSDSVLKKKKKKSCVSKMLCCLLPWLKCCRGNKQPK